MPIKQPEPIAQHVFKSLDKRLDANDIIQHKVTEIALRIMYLVNETVKQDTPHLIGAEGPYKDNTCCETPIDEYTTTLGYFIQKQKELQNKQSQEKLLVEQEKNKKANLGDYIKDTGVGVVAGVQDTASSLITMPERIIDYFTGEMAEEGKDYKPESVSYTHLTLPTSDLV